MLMFCSVKWQGYRELVQVAWDKVARFLSHSKPTMGIDGISL